MSTWQPARPRGSARLALRILPPLALFRAVAGADALLWPFLRYSAALWTCTGLDPRTRELVILRVAATEACDYQLAQHVPLARRAGLSENAIATAIRRPLPDPANPADTLDQRQHAALATADAILQATSEAPRANRAEPADIAVALLAGHYMAVARLCRLLDLPVDPPAATLRRRRTPARRSRNASEAGTTTPQRGPS